ncbi:MAG: type II CAAX endopeptidase family protein [Cyanobacteria bacterium P01_A01_bin.135]
MLKPLGFLTWLFGPAIANRPAPLRIGVFVGALLALWLPFYGLAQLSITDPNTRSIAVMAVLFLAFIFLLRFWSRTLYQARLRDRYGLTGGNGNGRELAVGLGAGAASLALLFGLMALLGWTRWRWPGLGIGLTALEGLLVALGVGLAEELVFRGWLWGELKEDYSANTALWGSSLTFAALHFIKPLPEMLRTAPQFPGLLLLGLLLVWARRRCRGRLGMAVGIHAGLVWGYYLAQVGGLVAPRSGPQWLTGVDGNPLAGGLGLLFLLGLGLWVRR